MKLGPCLCGAKVNAPFWEIDYISVAHLKRYYMECVKCRRITIGPFPTAKAAIEYWNNRPGEQAILDVLRKVTYAYHEMLTAKHGDKTSTDVLEEAYKMIGDE